MLDEEVASTLVITFSHRYPLRSDYAIIFAICCLKIDKLQNIVILISAKIT